MPKFKFDALSNLGKKQTGTIDASDITHARQILRARKLYPTNIKELKAGSLGAKMSVEVQLFKPKLKPNDLLLVIRQLATLVGAGITIEKSLSLMLEQADNRNTRRFIAVIKQYLAEGLSFTNALKQSGYKLSASFIATIEYAEETGTMETVLGRLADEIERQAKTSSSLMSALMYPALTIFVALVILSLLMVYVVPQITQVFIDSGKDLPGLTVIVIAISDFMRDNGSTLLALLLIILAIFMLAMQKDAFKFALHKKILNLPILGNWIMLSEIARWSRGLGVLLSSGVPAIQSMTIATHALNNVFLQDSFEKVSINVREGKSLCASLKMQSIFPGFFTHMVNTGESSGSLDKMLIKTADYYEQKIKIAIETLLKLFEPFLIIFMGTLVLLIVLAVLVPIFELNQLVM